MKVVDRNIEVNSVPQIISEDNDHFSLVLEEQSEHIQIYKLKGQLTSDTSPLMIKWKRPAVNVKGIWCSNALLDKRLRADWEEPLLVSRISVDSPVISVFKNDDENCTTVCLSETTETVSLEAAIQEEDNHIHFTLTFFLENYDQTQDYSCLIRVDQRKLYFGRILTSVSEWFEKVLLLKPAMVPLSAVEPVYSTWYAFHQNFTTDELLEECVMAADLGYKTLIVDDGWQTKDGQRGYDFTGDWMPERIGDVGQFVTQVHQIGMRIMLWYSVPFCGKKSQAYQAFKGKFLTEDHHWAPVFDPRFPEVRKYLIDKYLQAVSEWRVDGLKLDFIDEFKIYPATETEELKGRDTLSINQGVRRFIIDLKKQLYDVNAEILIEFRQQYVGPELRHVGNMFRAFDCPGDAVMNRVRTTDVKLLCGDSAVHSDMLTWHKEEPVEIAAFQLTSILFSVPQLSVRLATLSHEHLTMVGHFTQYWIANREIFLHGRFRAFMPLSNYPILKSCLDGKCIYAIYEDVCLDIETAHDEIDIINGKLGERIIIAVPEFLVVQTKVVNCQGHLISDQESRFSKGVHTLSAPVNGIISLIKI